MASPPRDEPQPQRSVSALSELLNRFGSGRVSHDGDLEDPLLEREHEVPVSRSPVEARAWPPLRLSSMSTHAISPNLLSGDLVRLLL